MDQGENFTTLQTIKEGLIYIKSGTSSFHFWFVYMILGVYLFIPLLSKWIQKAEEKEIRYFLLFWIFLLFIQLPGFAIFQTKFDLSYFSEYLGYLILGYYFSKFVNYSLPLSAILIIVGYLLTISGTIYLSIRNNSFTHVYYEYLSPNVVLLSSGVFLFFKTLNLKNRMPAFFILFRNSIAKYSFGIYLCHWLVILMLNNVGIGWWTISPLIGIPLTSVCCLIISYILVWLINHLPFGKYISG